ncbi:MAG: uroporphyrinogen-III C-methyltransferase [Alphaproteobacteria bacterium]|nr:uroporphyrinogen-III C-methyltransferase [Alphaproteobacteria bacterium]
MKMPGRVFLVGAGPGDPDLLTVKAMRLIASAETLVHDRLVSREILSLAPAAAKLIDVGKEPQRHRVPQDRINEILVREARAGRQVVRLKGGDPFIFGRGSEEALALRCGGIACEIVPGITAAQGCAAKTGVPLTHRGLATGVRYITGHCKQDQPLAFDWDSLADPATTLVVYMGAANIEEIAARLVSAGLPRTTPVLAVNNGTMRDERRLVSELGSVGDAIGIAQFKGPVVFIIGAVVNLYARHDICPVVRDAMAFQLCEQRGLVHA